MRGQRSFFQTGGFSRRSPVRGKRANDIGKAVEHSLVEEGFSGGRGAHPAELVVAVITVDGRTRREQQPLRPSPLRLADDLGAGHGRCRAGQCRGRRHRRKCRRLAAGCRTSSTGPRPMASSKPVRNLPRRTDGPQSTSSSGTRGGSGRPSRISTSYDGTRMHPRKRPLLFVDMVKLLLAEELDARLTLVGPDEGKGPAPRAAINDCECISWASALPRMRFRDGWSLRPAACFPRRENRIRCRAGSDVRRFAGSDLGRLRTCAVGRAHRLRPRNRRRTAGVRCRRHADRDVARAMGERGRQASQNDFCMRAVGARLIYIYTGNLAALVEPRGRRRTEGQAANVVAVRSRRGH